MDQDNRTMALSPRQTLNSQRVRRISGLHNTDEEKRQLRMATINVGSMRGRGVEVAEMLTRRRIDFCCVQEVRFKGQGARFVGETER